MTKFGNRCHLIGSAILIEVQMILTDVSLQEVLNLSVLHLGIEVLHVLCLRIAGLFGWFQRNITCE